jgi:hypothetical protein
MPFKQELAANFNAQGLLFLDTWDTGFELEADQEAKLPFAIH